mgnify:CR=1 FL=1|jgi:hypothetical protein
MDESTNYKVIRGAYKYLRNDTIYCEETFDVSKEKKENVYTFESVLHSRVATGELLTMKVLYRLNKEYVPTFVMLERNLGENSIKEIYDYDSRKNILKYSFLDTKGQSHDHELTTSNKFFITTPSTCCSMVFLRSKKFDNKGENHYNFWSSHNQWEFTEIPSITSISIKKMSTRHESISIEGNKLQALEYRLSEAQDDSLVETPEYIRIYLSKHVTIPYIVKDEKDNTTIQIKFLNNLD